MSWRGTRRASRLAACQAWRANCLLGLNRPLFRMRALRVMALAIDKLSDDLALGDAPARDNFPATLITNPYFVGVRLQHERPREWGRAQEERELATVALHSTSVMIRITRLGTSTPIKITMAVGESIAQSSTTRSSLHASSASHLVRSRAKPHCYLATPPVLKMSLASCRMMNYAAFGRGVSAASKPRLRSWSRQRRLSCSLRRCSK
jgi:hypothetical protein